MSAFSDFVGDGIDKIKPTQKNPILGVGSYDLTVNRCVYGKSQKNGTPFFAVEFDVNESTNVEIQKGTQAAYVISFGQYPDMGKRALLALLMKGMGMDEEEAKKAITKDLITGPDQILTGEKVKCVAVAARSAKSGKAYTDYRWAPGK